MTVGRFNDLYILAHFHVEQFREQTGRQSYHDSMAKLSAEMSFMRTPADGKAFQAEHTIITGIMRGWVGYGA